MLQWKIKFQRHIVAHWKFHYVPALPPVVVNGQCTSALEKDLSIAWHLRLLLFSESISSHNHGNEILHGLSTKWDGSLSNGFKKDKGLEVKWKFNVCKESIMQKKQLHENVQSNSSDAQQSSWWEAEDVSLTQRKRAQRFAIFSKTVASNARVECLVHKL